MRNLLNNRYKIGVGLLSFWMIFNLVLAVVIVAAMLFLQANPPGIYLIQSPVEVESLPAAALNTMRSLAILMNAAIAAFSLLGLLVLKYAFVKREQWAYWAIAICFGFVQLMGYVSDEYLGNSNLLVNTISLMVLVGGLVLTYPRK